MAPMKPLFRTVLQQCLDERRYPKVLFWVFGDLFFVNVMRLNRSEWNHELAQHFVHWDYENFNAGFLNRKPGTDLKYYSKSRHRYQQALKKMVDDRVLKPVPDAVNTQDWEAYRLLPEGTRGSSPPVQPWDVKPYFPVLRTRVPQNAENQNANNLLGILMQNVGILDDGRNMKAIPDAQGNFHNPVIAINEGANSETAYSSNVNSFLARVATAELRIDSSLETLHSSESRSKALLGHPTRDTGQIISTSTTSHLTLDTNLDALHNTQNGCHVLSDITQETLDVKNKFGGYSASCAPSPATPFVPLNTEPDKDTLQLSPNSWQAMSLFADDPAAQEDVEMESNVDPLQTPPNDFQKMFLFAGAPATQDELNMLLGIDTLQTPPNGLREVFSPAFQDVVNMEPCFGTLQTPPNDYKKIFVHAHSAALVIAGPGTDAGHILPDGSQGTSLFVYSTDSDLSVELRSELLEMIANENQSLCKGDTGNNMVQQYDQCNLIPPDSHGADEVLFNKGFHTLEQQANLRVAGDSDFDEDDMSWLDNNIPDGGVDSLELLDEFQGGELDLIALLDC